MGMQVQREAVMYANSSGRVSCRADRRSTSEKAVWLESDPNIARLLRVLFGVGPFESTVRWSLSAAACSAAQGRRLCRWKSNRRPSSLRKRSSPTTRGMVDRSRRRQRNGLLSEPAQSPMSRARVAGKRLGRGPTVVDQTVVLQRSATTIESFTDLAD